MKTRSRGNRRIGRLSKTNFEFWPFRLQIYDLKGLVTDFLIDGRRSTIGAVRLGG